LVGKLTVAAAETHGFRQIRYEGACGVRWRVLALFRTHTEIPWRKSSATGRDFTGGACEFVAALVVKAKLHVSLAY
jgi:hypothetical protein